MAVGLRVKSYYYNIGSGDFLYSFFSTVAYNLENKAWASRFPVIMKELYNGKISKENVANAIKELSCIKEALKVFSPNKAIWDFEDLSKQPPWGDKISNDITDMSNYFVTSDGEDFFDIFMQALIKAELLNAEYRNNKCLGDMDDRGKV